eukprot:TRINITY_DN37350_c0_g1_i1.p1 TRINITY_DN37350_c0_g1~~TRINITY_DN37350_c0_g1_i1.p1  ORF type:complete len:303 (+),score=83.16 TRINITY_DN37350_c0_g1_i1:68-976(+)
MPFKYVLIPASASEEMRELEYDGDIEDLTQDKFRETVESYFRGLGGDVDRGVLLEQLQQRTGMDLKAKAESGEMTGEALDRLLQSTSVEIFPVMLPTKDTGFEGISVYVDDKGIAKNLEENPRVSGLVQACGYPGQTFRGDCFIGRVFDDTEDEWRRVSFTLKDCSTDAPWVAATKKQRSNRSSSDMTSLASQMGVHNPAHIRPGDAEEPKGETAQYSWKQVEDEVEITFKKEGLSKGDKKAVRVNFARTHLKVEAKGETLIDADLHAATRPDESTWTLSDGVLQVVVSKVVEESWPALLKA